MQASVKQSNLNLSIMKIVKAANGYESTINVLIIKWLHIINRNKYKLNITIKHCYITCIITINSISQ